MTQEAAPLCVLTRPLAASERFAARVTDRFGIACVISPLIDIRFLDVSIELDSFEAVILTSAQASARLEALGVPKTMPCFAVGDRTAEAARALGYTATSAGGNADDLIALLKRERSGGTLLHLRGEHSRGEVAARLTKLGMACEEVVIYQQIAKELSKEAVKLITSSTPVVLPLFSPRTASLLMSHELTPEAVSAVAMSKDVMSALGDFEAAETILADTPTEDAMLGAMATAAPLRRLLERNELQS